MADAPATLAIPSGTPLAGDPALSEVIATFVAPRAAGIDAGVLSPRDGIAHLAALDLVELGVLGRSEPADFARMCEVVAAVAGHDMTQAFTLWCHRMAVEYLYHASEGSALRQRLLPRLRSGEVAGSTAFAAATAAYLAGTPLPVTFRRDGDTLVASGRIAWASNLQPPFVSVTAAVNADDPSDRAVFAFTESTPGLRLPPCPELLALQATASTSPAFEDARIDADHQLTNEFDGFFVRVFATFILLQCSFCWGLAERACREVASSLTGQREVLRDDCRALTARFDGALARLRDAALAPDRTALRFGDLLRLRLDWGRLAVDAVALEAKLAGGRGYLRDSGTSRRLREAAFLPVQAPTEVQLRWLLSHSA